ncbi:MAG TPA: CpXC domain-containing protein [Ktedonobacteraceae bacterium]|nr:CpXC domain-containing protein [Ktedonobacteraceae bacterium]
MSRASNYTFTCPCGQTFESQIYEYVNTEQDPRLQYTILAGLFNTPSCPNCGRRAALSNPFIYSDPEHGLLAYVHPSAELPEEAKDVILEELRALYLDIEEKRVRQGQGDELPLLQIVFGIDQLIELINAHLEPDERLGKLALSTQSASEAERGRLLDIARKLASEMQCLVDVEDYPDEYTVWMYGSRRRIGALMRDLAPRGM